MAGGSVVNGWGGIYSRNPLAYNQSPPSLLPLAIPITNTGQGNWLFAFVAWRQDGGAIGSVLFPSTCNVSDDAGNFWIPVKNVPATTTVGPATSGIIRTAIWMAPAAGQAQFVFISPTSTAAGDAYQSGLAVEIIEVTADGPWYTVEEAKTTSLVQVSSASVTSNTTTGLFSVGFCAYDNFAMPAGTTSTGWTAQSPVSTNNGVNHTGDLEIFPFVATTAGSPLTLSIFRTSGVNVSDMAITMITVHGVADTIPFPYAQPLENWPVLVTEIASGPVLNLNPAFANGLTGWTAAGGSEALVSWPVYQPWPNYQALSLPSVQLTPNGSSQNSNIGSDLQPVSTTQQYTVLGFAYSVGGFGTGTPTGGGSNIGVYAGINWFDSGFAYISTSGGTLTTLEPGTWTQLDMPVPVFPPVNAVYGSAEVNMFDAGNVPPQAVIYVGYCGFGLADAYENVPADEIAWADLSSRAFSQGAISVNRGIQYEQQQLEAGTMTVYLANEDGAVTFGNMLSSYWPTIGDTDVPIRLRAIYPFSVNPYYVLFSGFTDQIQFGWDQGTRYGYAEIEASDAWSRLVSQMLTAQQQEILEDSPVVYCTCNLSGANIALDNNTPMQVLPSSLGPGPGETSTFSSSVISLLGGQGLDCWQSTVQAGLAFVGVALAYFPPPGNPLPPTAAGITVEFWMSPQAVSASQSTATLTVCACWSGNGPVWIITINNNAGAGSSTASVTVYDQTTGAGTTTSIGANLYLGSSSALASYFFAVTFNQTSLTVVVNPGDTNQNTVTVGANLTDAILGFSLGGNAGPIVGFNSGATLGFMSIAISNFAVFDEFLPQARLTAHYQTAKFASNNEIDTWRLARIAGYAGATPVVMGMRGLDMAAGPDLDLITAVTDTSGQVTSSYFTNIAASTLAFMFVNGAGTLIYRRRLEGYDRTASQWVAGEQASQPYAANTLSAGPSVGGWSGGNGATLVSSSLRSVSPVFEFCGLFHGDGVTGQPYIGFGTIGTSPVTPGQLYQLSCVLYSPQGYAAGLTLYIDYYTAGAVFVSNCFTTLPSLGAGVLTYIQTTATIGAGAQVPNTAGFAALFLQCNGTTPASNVQFYVANMEFVQIQPTPIGGSGSFVPEVPYLVDTKLSSDRALLYNQAILTQYGTSTQVTFKGPSLVFTPTSGILVTIQNTESVQLRAGVPYTATSYINNTAQQLPYELNDPSMEDFGNWITQTLSTPLLRPDQVTITPASTVQATLMALGADVGDTVTFRRRPLGAPEIQIITYISKLSHEIDIASGRWNTKYELSPFAQGNVLKCDDVILGTLTGGNWYGW